MIPNYSQNNTQQYYQNYPQYPQIQQPVQYQTPPIQNQILAWVKDEKEALDFPLSPGQSIFLMTRDESYLFAKTCDQLGKITFFKKKLIDESVNENVNVNDFVRKEEIENIIMDKIQSEIEKKFSEISFKPTKARKQVIIDEE